MKPHLLMLLFLCAALMGTGQKVNTLDSTFRSTDGSITYNLEDVQQRTYDSVCRNDTATSGSFDILSPTPFPQNATRYLKQYYMDGSIRQVVFQTFQGTGSSPAVFTNFTRDRYRDSASGNSLIDTSEIWNGSTWSPSGLTTTQYNTARQTTLYLYKRWNTSMAQYVNNYRVVQTYNAAGSQTLYSDESWDTTSGKWYVNFDVITIYDANNFITSDTVKESFTTGGATLLTDNYITFKNNSSGKIDTSIQIHLPSNRADSAFYSYYPGFGLIQQVSTYTYDSSGQFSYAFRVTHTYDSSGGIYSDSTLEEFQAEDTGTFRPISRFVDRKTYDADSLVVVQESGSLGYDNDGQVSNSNLYKTYSYYEPCQTVLPVSLLSFTANKEDNNAVLQWKTSNETNTASFAVQRSTDGIHFITIGKVKAAGNNNIEKSYAYTDFIINALGVNKIYYRLAQQDANGAIHNSAIAQIDITNGKLSIILSPNPVRNSIGIYSPVAMTNAVIRIADMSGKLVYASRTNLAAGTIFNIDASAFSKGMYFVTIQSGTDKQVLKLVKE